MSFVPSQESKEVENLFKMSDPSVQYSSHPHPQHQQQQTSTKPSVKQILHKRGVHSDFTDIILWQKPLVTGGILGGVTTVYIVFEVLELNFLATLLFIAFIGLSALFVWGKVAELTKLNGPIVPSYVRQGFSGTENEPKLISFVKGTIVPYLDRALAIVNAVVEGRDVFLAAAVLGGLLGSSWIVNRVNALTVTFLSILFLFTIPKIYEYKQDDIDHYIGVGQQRFGHYYNQGRNQASQYYKDIQAKVPSSAQKKTS